MKTGKKAYGFGWIYERTKGARFPLAMYALVILLSTVIQLSMAYFLKLFVDIATGESGMTLLTVGALSIALIGLGGIVLMISAVLSKLIYGRIERGLRTDLMDIIFSRRMADISKQHTGELLTRLTADTQAVSACFPNIIEHMVGGIASALLATAALFLLNWKMAVIMFVAMPLLMVVLGILTPFIEKASLADKQNDEANRSVMQESLGRIMLIKAYFMRGKTVEKVKSSYAHKLKSGMRLGLWGGVASFSGTLMSFSVFIVVLGVGAYFVMTGETTLGNLIAMVQLLNYIVNPVARFAETISQISQAVASAGRIGMVCELPADTEAAATAPVDAVELVAENMRFAYDGADTILDGVNVSFAKGMVTGIAGKSGSGKSTLLKLLIGLYTPDAGKILLRHPSGVLSGEEIMPQVAYVPPADYLFSGTVAENIIMAESTPRRGDMETAADGANILDFIQSLPDGFDTPVGEGGSTVSSGQAQRLAIARAIYKKSPVIIFDEPTANLDVDSIEKFQSAVRLLAKDKICIVVTHDVSTITVCDRVYVLEEGDVREMDGEGELVLGA